MDERDWLAERFEDLPTDLQDALLRAPARQVDARRVRVRARRSLGYAVAGAVLFWVPGAWLVSMFAAPLAILNAGLALRDSRGVPKLSIEWGLALAGLIVSTAVLVLALIHVRRVGLAFDALRPLLQ